MIKKMSMVGIVVVSCLFIYINYTSSKIFFSAHLQGAWYQDIAVKLTAQLSEMNDYARYHYDMNVNNYPIYALVVPHAGYIYSGAIAAAAYSLVNKSVIDRIVVLAPVHDGTVSGIALANFDYYKIPTGIIAIDNALSNVLADKNLFKKNREIFSREHSFEMQLPLIHYYFPQAKVLPLLVGYISLKDIPYIAEVLQSLINDRTLFVVSSDMTHYGPRYGYMPFTDNIVSHIRYIDGVIMNALSNYDIASILAYENSDYGLSVCGITPIKLLITMIKNGVFNSVSTRLVAYGSSDRILPMSDDTVTYASYIIMKKNVQEELSGYDKMALLAYARDMIKAAFDNKLQDVVSLRPLITEPMHLKRGVFVTLYKKSGNEKELRGCVGHIINDTPLIDLVGTMALEAAFNDSRFAPLTREEFDSVVIEISILQAPYSIASYKDIILGKHGIMLTVPKNSEHRAGNALFLPKVPQQFNMNTIEETLTHLSKKAGLDVNAWQLPEAQIKVFEGIEFSE